MIKDMKNFFTFSLCFPIIKTEINGQEIFSINKGVLLWILW